MVPSNVQYTQILHVIGQLHIIKAWTITYIHKQEQIISDFNLHIVLKLSFLETIVPRRIMNIYSNTMKFPVRFFE